jgi:hypothetical protein
MIPQTTFTFCLNTPDKIGLFNDIHTILISTNEYDCEKINKLIDYVISENVPSGWIIKFLKNITGQIVNPEPNHIRVKICVRLLIRKDGKVLLGNTRWTDGMRMFFNEPISSQKSYVTKKENDIITNILHILKDIIPDFPRVRKREIMRYRTLKQNLPGGHMELCDWVGCPEELIKLFSELNNGIKTTPENVDNFIQTSKFRDVLECEQPRIKNLCRELMEEFELKINDIGKLTSYNMGCEYTKYKDFKCTFGYVIESLSGIPEYETKSSTEIEKLQWVPDEVILKSNYFQHMLVNFPPLTTNYEI